MARRLGAHLIVGSGHRDGFAVFASGWRFHTRNRSPILELDPDREIVAINIERDLNILRVQIRTGGIVKALDLAASQDEPTNGVCIA
jgi:hypothetical protein